MSHVNFTYKALLKFAFLIFAYFYTHFYLEKYYSLKYSQIINFILFNKKFITLALAKNFAR